MKANSQGKAKIDSGSLTAFFLPVEPGWRFCIHYGPAPAQAGRGSVVYVHPFAEEMNKSRRMAARQSRRLAAAGFGVLQIDLFGCGDSSGDFAEARWEIWKRDVKAAAAWLHDRTGGPLCLWGLRIGAALAVDVARDPAAGVDRLLLWQPVANGEQFLNQFLRLQLAAEMLAGGAAQTGVRELRAELARGSSLEIGGYELHPELAAGLDAMKLTAVPAAALVDWLEVSPDAATAVIPASLRVLDAWRAGGADVRSAVVGGDPFWSTLEIAECAALLDATDGAMADERR